MNTYAFTIKKADGSTLSLEDYRGKVLLLVNTASYCGYTKQLLGLEKLYKEYQKDGLEILAFPANQFRSQEPDPIDRIVKTYQEKYGVTFPVMDKVLVNGEGADPLYSYLKGALPFDPKSNTPEVMIPIYQEGNPDYLSSPDIKWNFTKFLIDKNGVPVKRFEPEETPSMLIEDIKALLY